MHELQAFKFTGFSDLPLPTYMQEAVQGALTQLFEALAKGGGIAKYPALLAVVDVYSNGHIKTAAFERSWAKRILPEHLLQAVESLPVLGGDDVVVAIATPEGSGAFYVRYSQMLPVHTNSQGSTGVMN